MKNIKCPDNSCGKEFERPIVVSNFVFVPKKNTYFACPYCLTRISEVDHVCDSVVNGSDIEIRIEDSREIDTRSTERQNSSCFNRVELNQSVEVPLRTIEEIKNLEKEKADLLLQLDELKKNAVKKANSLEYEIDSLKKETEKLKKFINE
jgi:predicted RNase H-like nuclease (RuvC/YqgF family)